MITLTKYMIMTGEISGWISVVSEEDARLNAFSLFPGQAMLDGLWEKETYYIDNEEALLRPVIVIPTSHELALNTDWHLPDIPEGTEVIIDGDVVGTADATGLTLSFDTPGVWPVTLVPPFPWVKANCEVVVE